jgi:UDP-2,3-diacylglucosamine hydrolase
MKAIFFSDAHLTDNEADRIGTVSRAIRDITKDADVVFFLGDLFEFYHGYDGFVYPFYKEFVELLSDVAAGRPVYFIEGNHEFGLGRHFESYTGVRCVESLTINIDDRKVFLSHGDEIGSPILRRVLKSRVIYSIMDGLGPGLTWKIAMMSRIFLSKSHKPYDRKILNRFRRYGRKKLQEGYDAVILGHSHMADIEEYEWNGRQKTYLNTGDFITSLTYGVYVTEKGFAVRRYGEPDSVCAEDTVTR